MKNTYTLIAVAIILGWVSTARAVSPAVSVNQQAINEEIINLPWHYELKSYSLEQSNSTFQLTRGYSLLSGKAARRYNNIIQESEEDLNTEALVFNHNTGVRLILNYYSDGYVSLEDWEHLDADILMQQIIDNTRKINTKRFHNNIAPLRIGGWLQKPRLDKSNHSVSWVFDVIDGEETTVNAVSIKLGRKGYEKITWISSYDNYLKSMDAMKSLVDQHQFNKGYRYSDYSLGDRIATLGVASLVAITAGGNPQKAGLAALYDGLIAFGKKLLIPLLFVLGALEIYCRKLLNRKNQDNPPDPLYI